eukprot:1161585-Pelagomonas_calceolata.AAC.14
MDLIHSSLPHIFARMLTGVQNGCAVHQGWGAAVPLARHAAHVVRVCGWHGLPQAQGVGQGEAEGKGAEGSHSMCLGHAKLTQSVCSLAGAQGEQLHPPPPSLLLFIACLNEEAKHAKQALKQFTTVITHFKDIEEDQFDFHKYQGSNQRPQGSSATHEGGPGACATNAYQAKHTVLKVLKHDLLCYKKDCPALPLLALCSIILPLFYRGLDSDPLPQTWLEKGMLGAYTLCPS